MIFYYVNWGAWLGWSLTLYCLMWKVGQMTIEKTDPRLSKSVKFSESCRRNEQSSARLDRQLYDRQLHLADWAIFASIGSNLEKCDNRKRIKLDFLVRRGWRGAKELARCFCSCIWRPDGFAAVSEGYLEWNVPVFTSTTIPNHWLRHWHFFCFEFAPYILNKKQFEVYADKTISNR